jgi:hypothetical protein
MKTINLSCCKFQEQFPESDTSISVSTGDLATMEKFPTGYMFLESLTCSKSSRQGKARQGKARPKLIWVS